MLSFMNIVTVFNLLSLVSAAMIPVAAIYLHKDTVFIVLNQWVISQSLAVFLDSDTIIRTQIAFSRRGEKTEMFAAGFSSRAFSSVPLALCIGTLELALYGFSYYVAIGARNVQNYFRMSVPQLKKFERFSYLANAIACIRNIGLLVAVIVFEPQDFAFFLVLLLLLEWVLLPLCFFNGLRNLTWSSPVAILVRLLRNVFKRFISKTSAKVPALDAMRSIVDRALILILLDEPSRILYLKLKTASQYIEAFVSIFSYQFHLEIVRKRSIGTLRRYWIVILWSVLVGTLSFTLIMNDRPISELYLWVFFSLLISCNRVVMSVAGSLLMATAKFRTLVALYGFEIGLLCLVLLTGRYMFGAGATATFAIFLFSGSVAAGLFVASAIRNNTAHEKKPDARS